jgi:hypothetical protein
MDDNFFTVLLIEPNKVPEVISVNDDYQQYKKLLKCNNIEPIYMTLNGKDITILTNESERRKRNSQLQYNVCIMSTGEPTKYRSYFFQLAGTIIIGGMSSAKDNKLLTNLDSEILNYIVSSVTQDNRLIEDRGVDNFSIRH